MSSKLEIDALRALKAIVTYGGVTKAADKLSLSQSAVSHKIRRLEKTIGCRLLRRKRGAPLLTEEGERLLEYAVRIIILHDEALSTLGRKTLAGQVRLGLTEDMICAGLARVLARFARLYPSVEVRAHVTQSLELGRQLDGGTIDLAVLQVFDEDVRLGDRVLSTDQPVWIEGRDFRSSATTPMPFIAFGKDCFFRNWAEGQASLKDTGLKIKTVLECSSVAGICNATAAGLGAALVNRRHLRNDLQEIETGLPVPPPVAYVMRSHSNPASNSVRVLMDEISGEFAA